MVGFGSLLADPTRPVHAAATCLRDGSDDAEDESIGGHRDSNPEEEPAEGVRSERTGRAHPDEHRYREQPHTD